MPSSEPADPGRAPRGDDPERRDEAVGSADDMGSQGSKMMVGPGVAMTNEMAVGGGLGVLTGALAVGALAVVVGLVLRATGLVSWLTFGVVVATALVAGATAGAVIGGSRRATEEHVSEQPGTTERGL